MHAGFSGFRVFVARKKGRCKLIENRLVLLHDTISPIVTAKCKKAENDWQFATKRQMVKNLRMYSQRSNQHIFKPHKPTQNQSLQKSCFLADALPDIRINGK